MKLNIRNISLILVIVLAIGILGGCTPKDKGPLDKPPIVDVDPPVVDPPMVDNKSAEISPTEKVSIENLTLLDKYEFDFNGDGVDENISIYTDAERHTDGEIMWDDGQRWLFVVHDSDMDYVLFDDYVQLGTIKFNVYTENQNDFYITSLKSTTAGLKLTEYKYDKEASNFISTVKFEAAGDINMLHTSYGY